MKDGMKDDSESDEESLGNDGGFQVPEEKTG